MKNKLDVSNGLLNHDSRYNQQPSLLVLLLLLLIPGEYVTKGKKEWSEFIQPNTTHRRLVAYYVSLKKVLGSRNRGSKHRLEDP